MSNGFNLNQEELAQVVQRAHEIESVQERLEATDNTIDDYVSAAGEMGISEAAMRQALEERFAFIVGEIEEGTLVFAKSGDGRSYPAKVKSVGEKAIDVEFLNGGSATVSRHELQEANFSPGTRFSYYSPMNMSYINGAVVSVNRTALTATFNTWGIEETVPLSKVRINKPSNFPKLEFKTWMLIAGGVLSGGVIGALITMVLR